MWCERCQAGSGGCICGTKTNINPGETWGCGPNRYEIEQVIDDIYCSTAEDEGEGRQKWLVVTSMATKKRYLVPIKTVELHWAKVEPEWKIGQTLGWKNNHGYIDGRRWKLVSTHDYAGSTWGVVEWDDGNGNLSLKVFNQERIREIAESVAKTSNESYEVIQ